MYFGKTIVKLRKKFPSQLSILSFSFLLCSFVGTHSSLNAEIIEDNPYNTIEIKEEPKTKKRFSFSDDDLFPDIKEIQDRGELVVAMYYQDKPPFYFVNDEGRLVGNDPELAEAIAKAIGPNIRVRYLRTAKTFDEIIQHVHDGKADIAISKLSYTIPRSKRVLYSKNPYIKLYIAFMVNRSAPSSFSLSELFSNGSGYKLCAIKGSSQVKVAQKLFPHIDIIQVPNAEETVEGLTKGKCIASIRDNNEIRKILLDDPKLNLRYKAVILKDQPDPIFIVTDPKKRNVATFIDRLLENNQRYKRTLNQIFAKYEDQLR